MEKKIDALIKDVEKNVEADAQGHKDAMLRHLNRALKAAEAQTELKKKK